jgi:hypothetical protein
VCAALLSSSSDLSPTYGASCFLVEEKTPMHQPFFLLLSAGQSSKEQQQTKLQLLLFFSHLNGPFMASLLEVFFLF